MFLDQFGGSAGGLVDDSRAKPGLGGNGHKIALNLRVFKVGQQKTPAIAAGKSDRQRFAPQRPQHPRDVGRFAGRIVMHLGGPVDAVGNNPAEDH